MLRKVLKLKSNLRSFATDKVGVSEVVALVLVTSIVVISIAGIILIAGPQIVGSQQGVEIEQVEQALTQFDDDAHRVAVGGTRGQRIELGLGSNLGTLDTEPKSGHVTVEYVDVIDSVETVEIVNTSIGTVVYDHGETTIGYQGGGVWRSDGSHSVLVSPPEITFRNGTLTMPLVKTQRRGSVHSDVQISHEESTTRFPTGNLTNKIEDVQIRITIQSRYYRAWGRFFEEEAKAVVQYPGDETVVVTFLALPRDFSPDAGVIATSGPGEILLEGNGAYIDSYNSTKGPYKDSNTKNGVVIAAGDVIMKGDSQIDGDVRSGQNIGVNSSSAQIDGNANYTENIYKKDNDSVTGGTYQINGVPEIPPIDWFVENKTEYLRDNNDNNETTIIDNNELVLDGTGTLGSGKYYLEKINLQGETLELNTTDGDVIIGVRDYVTLEKYQGQNSHINVEGTGDVMVFVASEQLADVSVPGGGQAPVDEVHFYAERNATVDVGGEESLQFQVFAPDHFVGAIGGSSSENADITATIVAPAGHAGSGEFFIQHGELYGAIVTGNLTLGQYGQVHFDRSLIGGDIPLAPEVPRIEYLYITEHQIRVESS